MKIVSVWKRIARKLTPPGNRAPLDEMYRQPRMDPEHQMSGGTEGLKASSGGGT